MRGKQNFQLIEVLTAGRFNEAAHDHARKGALRSI